MYLAMYLFGNSATNTSQSMSAFQFLALVSPVTYSVGDHVHTSCMMVWQIANVCKRIIVIAASMLVFRNPVTPANAGGMLLAILGAVLWCPPY